MNVHRRRIGGVGPFEGVTLVGSCQTVTGTIVYDNSGEKVDLLCVF